MEVVGIQTDEDIVCALWKHRGVRKHRHGLASQKSCFVLNTTDKNFDATPHPGDLKHRLVIGYTMNTVNENGYPQAKDVILCRVWGSATDAGNQHYRSADTMNTEAVVNFTIRYRNDVKPGINFSPKAEV